jgi:hypothetical protein
MSARVLGEQTRGVEWKARGRVAVGGKRGAHKFSVTCTYNYYDTRTLVVGSASLRSQLVMLLVG